MEEELENLPKSEKGPAVTTDYSSTKDHGKTVSSIGYTIDEALSHIGFGPAQFKLLIMTGIAWLADGMEIMVLSILGPTMDCVWGISPWKSAFLTTVVFCGYLIGSWIFGHVSDKYGRKISLVSSALVGLFFGIACGFSPSYVYIAVFRFGVGIGVGGLPQTVTYYSEFLPTEFRGKLIILIEIFFALGGVVEVFLAMIFMHTWGWRAWLIFTAFPLAIFLSFCYWLPKSPRYLLASGKISEAQEVLEKMAANNEVSLPEGELMPEKEVPRGQCLDLLSVKYRLTSLLLFFIWFSTGFSYFGIILVTTEFVSHEGNCDGDYLPGILPVNINGTHLAADMCKPLGQDDYVSLMWTSAAELPSLLLTATLVDVLGRKIMLSGNYLAFAASCLLLLICMTMIPMLIILFITRAVMSSILQLCYLYTPEVYPTQIRALGLGIGSGFGRMGAIVTPYVAQVLIIESSRLTVTVYAIVGLLASVAAMALPIETKGKTLQGTDVLH